MSIVKPGSLKRMRRYRTRRPRRTIVSITGDKQAASCEAELTLSFTHTLVITHPFLCIGGVDFPGDVLIGMDLLRRFSFNLLHHISPPSTTFMINSCQLPVRFADTDGHFVTTAGASTR